MPIITLPDGSKKVFEKSVTILEIAQSIGAGLAKATIAGKVNDVLLDATIPIELSLFALLIFFVIISGGSNKLMRLPSLGSLLLIFFEPSVKLIIFEPFFMMIG